MYLMSDRRGVWTWWREVDATIGLATSMYAKLGGDQLFRGFSFELKMENGLSLHGWIENFLLRKSHLGFPDTKLLITFEDLDRLRRTYFLKNVAMLT